jgi:hypothetical protein
MQKALCYGARVVPITRVEGGLAAARLIARKIDVVSETTQDANRVEADFGQELVDKAWNEQGDLHSRNGRRTLYSQRQKCPAEYAFEGLSISNSEIGPCATGESP